MSRFVCSFVSDTSYRVEQVGRYELFKLVESLLQFAVVLIESSVTVVDSCLDQFSAGRFDDLDGLLSVQWRLESKSSGIVETSVNVTNNSHSRDYSHPYD